jgi:hypothetical protein
MKIMSDKKFLIVFAAALAAIIAVSYALHVLDLTVQDNDISRQYQMRKMEGPDGRAAEIIIVGDSSAGNAIDVEYFSGLSGSKTISMALTGSFGLIGTYNMIRMAADRMPKLRCVVIIQTPYIWSRKFRFESYFDTMPRLSIDDLSLLQGRGIIDLRSRPLREYVLYSTNPREIVWHFRRYVLGIRNPEWEIDPANDWAYQGKKRYSSGSLAIAPNTRILDPLEPSNMEILKLIDGFTEKRGLVCIVMHGPMHATVYANSGPYYRGVDEMIRKTVRHIIAIPGGFGLEPSYMGDRVDHVDPRSKKTVTRMYYEKMRGLLPARTEER